MLIDGAVTWNVPSSVRTADEGTTSARTACEAQNEGHVESRPAMRPAAYGG